jgi:hypothetical protein
LVVPEFLTFRELGMRLKDANKSNAHQANAKRCTFYTKCCSFRAVSL